MVPAPMRALLVAGLLGGCASCAVLGPDFTPPREATPDLYAGTPATLNAVGETVPSMRQEPDWHWWQQFNDRELDHLEELAVAGNLDLQMALLRIVESRAQVQIARAQGLPSVKATASAEREQLGLAGLLKARGSSSLTNSAEAQGLITSLEQPINIYQVGFDASWELDLFGKVARSVESARAQSDAAVESRNDALVSLEAEVAQTYFQLRAAQMLRDITLQELSDQREILQLTLNRQMSGLSSQSAVESARAQLSSSEAQLPQYDETIATSSHALAVLVGETPTALDAELQANQPLPSLPATAGIGLPSSLARRRPDIRQAEASLHAATAEIGVSVASMFPDVTLSGTAGVRNTAPKYLFNWASKFYTFGPSVSVPIFQGGALVANVRLARAQAAEAALNYRKTVLSALQEVEDALVTLHDENLRVVALRDAVAANQRSLDLSLSSYRSGLATYIDVLTAESQTIGAKQQLDGALLNEGTDLVKLYKAAGGGWQNTPVAADGSQPAIGTVGNAGLIQDTSP